MQDLIRQLLAELGEDPGREGLHNTPKRVEKALKFLTSGYDANLDDIVNGALFTVDYSEMVIVKDIDFYSLCEHHLLPFYGKAHVAYMPVDRVVGLSKLARLVDVYARRLQTQEHLTSQVATAIDEILKPRGVAVMIEAEHMCMSLRGVEKPGALTVRTHFTGAFREDAGEQVRFMTMLRGGQR
jgi:GTP cyclohydrolase I